MNVIIEICTEYYNIFAEHFWIVDFRDENKQKSRYKCN